MLGSIINKFNKEAKQHSERQSLNPFSDRFSRSPSPRPSKEEYGRPVEGSLTDIRGQKAKSHILREILDLCNCIHDVGIYNKQVRSKDPDPDDEPPPDDEIIVTFGEIFQIYTKINDKVVGLLIAAKKRGFVFFDREILFQRRDDDVLIALIKPIREIRQIINKEITPQPSPTVERRKIQPQEEESSESKKGNEEKKSSKNSKHTHKAKNNVEKNEENQNESKTQNREELPVNISPIVKVEPPSESVENKESSEQMGACTPNRERSKTPEINKDEKTDSGSEILSTIQTEIEKSSETLISDKVERSKSLDPVVAEPKEKSKSPEKMEPQQKERSKSPGKLEIQEKERSKSLESLKTQEKERSKSPGKSETQEKNRSKSPETLGSQGKERSKSPSKLETEKIQRSKSSENLCTDKTDRSKSPEIIISEQNLENTTNDQPNEVKKSQSPEPSVIPEIKTNEPEESQTDSSVLRNQETLAIDHSEEREIQNATVNNEVLAEPQATQDMQPSQPTSVNSNEETPNKDEQNEKNILNIEKETGISESQSTIEGSSKIESELGTSTVPTGQEEISKVVVDLQSQTTEVSENNASGGNLEQESTVHETQVGAGSTTNNQLEIKNPNDPDPPELTSSPKED